MAGVLARNKRFVLANESRGKGCGWANERQKEGMLIMYLCCEVSAGVCVFVSGERLRKYDGDGDGAKKKIYFSFKSHDVLCSMYSVICR